MKSSGNRVNGRTVLTITGALIAYLIGAGFASGNEVLQVFGSWGRKSVLGDFRSSFSPGGR